MAGTGVTLNVLAKKLAAESVGHETEAPGNDPVEIGVFAPGDGDARGQPFDLEQHRIQSWATIRIDVPRELSRAGIDTDRKLIDPQGDDNGVALDVGSRRGPAVLRPLALERAASASSRESRGSQRAAPTAGAHEMI